MDTDTRVTRVSVVIPAHNEAHGIARTVEAVCSQARPDVEIEIVVVDDGSTDGTPELAEASGARVIRMGNGAGGNPARARNLGARETSGDPIVFLDADCVPGPGWLDALLAAHDSGHAVVGGALDLPAGLPFTARCDYYCGFYLIHSRRPPGEVPHHPPPNLSVRREVFMETCGFSDRAPLQYTNEERAWQAEVRQAGHTMWFEPAARAEHHNRPGFGNLLRRNYRWAYTAIASKNTSGSARMAWIYRFPWLTVFMSLPLSFAHTAYIVWCWLRAGVVEPLVMLPAILISRLAYGAGMGIGGLRWLLRGRDPVAERGPRWS